MPTPHNQVECQGGTRLQKRQKKHSEKLTHAELPTWVSKTKSKCSGGWGKQTSGFGSWTQRFAPEHWGRGLPETWRPTPERAAAVGLAMAKSGPEWPKAIFSGGGVAGAGGWGLCGAGRGTGQLDALLLRQPSAHEQPLLRRAARRGPDRLGGGRVGGEELHVLVHHELGPLQAQLVVEGGLLFDALPGSAGAP